MKFPDLIVVTGPTSSGKTDLLTRLSAEAFEIVSFDSRQIYRGLSTGTAAPTREDIQKVPHHLTEILEPSERMDANYFRKLAYPIVEEIRSRGKIPILTAGTGFYLKAFLQGMYPVPKISEDLKRYVADLSPEEVLQNLHRIDPNSLRLISKNDFYRYRRALETGLAGKKWSELGAEKEGGYLNQNPSLKWEGYLIFWERGALYERINQRCKRILKGMADEAWEVSRAYGEDCPGLKTLGYNFALDYRKGRITIESFYEELAKAHRNYAKRQITWFQKEPYLQHISWESLLGRLQELESKINKKE